MVGIILGLKNTTKENQMNEQTYNHYCKSKLIELIDKKQIELLNTEKDNNDARDAFKKEYVQDFSSLSKELCATKNKLKNLIVSKGFFLLSKEVNIESLVCDSEDKSSLKVMSDFLYCSWMKKIKEEGKLKEVLKMIDIKY